MRNEYQAWYKRAVWLKLRAYHLAHYPLCEMCKRDGVLVAATVVNHIKPHRGDWTLFNNADNLQSLCVAHHNRDAQQQDIRGHDHAVGADGWPIDARDPFNRGRGV